ncbi:MAG: APC family permease [bacterium]|nr:APC family permease [bacterium]
MTYFSTRQFAFLTAAAIFNLFGLSMLAQQELTAISYIVYSLLFFLIPAALVSAELSSAFAKSEGGVYTWVRQALSPFWGTLAIFMQWAQSLALYPILLGFGGVAAAYVIGADWLINKGLFLGLFSIVVYWLATWINLRGHETMVKVTNYSFALGMLGSVIILVLLAVVWILAKKPIGFLHLNASETAVAEIVNNQVRPRFFPEINSLNSIAFLAAITLLFAGVESQTVHALKLKNPEKQLPAAIFLASGITFLMFLLGGLAIAVIVPYGQITTDAGLFRAYQIFAETFHLPWLPNILSALIIFGMFGAVTSWIGGPSRGMLIATKEGQLPTSFTKVNKNGIQLRIILIQGILVTLLCSIYLIFPNPNVGFFFMSTFTVGLYLIMYLLMYAAAIFLRYRQPNLLRPYKIPGGKVGTWLIAGGGFIAAAFALIVSFFPPTTLTVGNDTLYVSLAIGGSLFFICLCLILNLWGRREARSKH